MTELARGVCVVALACSLGSLAWAADAGGTKPAAAKPAAAPLQTLDDMKQLFADGKYIDVIRGVAKITASREWQADKHDAYDLYMIKGEAHLHQKENALAASSFEAAAKIVSDKAAAEKAIIDKGTKEKPADPAVIDKYNANRAAIGLARSMAYLVKHSTGMFYVPKATANQRVAGGNPNDHVKLDIVSTDTRKAALTAVWTDAKNAAAQLIATASDLDAKSIPAVMEVAKLIPDLRDFDFGANGNDDDTTKAATAVADHGRDLLQQMIDKMSVRLDVISTEALTLEESRFGLVGGGYTTRWKHHGLEAKQGAELKTMVKDSSDIIAAVKLLSEGLSPDIGYFDKSAKDARRIHDHADKLLKMDYSETFLNREAAMKAGA